MHSNVTIKNVSWPHFSWPTLYLLPDYDFCSLLLRLLHEIVEIVSVRGRLCTYLPLQYTVATSISLTFPAGSRTVVHHDLIVHLVNPDISEFILWP